MNKSILDFGDFLHSYSILKQQLEIELCKDYTSIDFCLLYFFYRCLLGHCFAIWFVHLPAYVKSCHNKKKVLHDAFEVSFSLHIDIISDAARKVVWGAIPPHTFVWLLIQEMLMASIKNVLLLIKMLKNLLQMFFKFIYL